jgi:hypothetical protein
LERWTRSDHSQEDLALLLEGVSGWSECGAAVSSYLHGLSNRDKYQQSVSVLLEYLKTKEPSHSLADPERR